ncbi:MAG: hypothetical protein QG597_4380 [Actinomycetota bacterium]|nr:hypothetical protein [Actinomycetota bacterium]
MKAALLVVNSVVGAMLLTLATVVMGLLWLMFSSGEGTGRHETLFGSVFFEATRDGGGAIRGQMGVENPVGLVSV